MTAVIAATVLAALCGSIVAKRLDPEAPGARTLGEGILIGFGLAAAVLLVLGVIGPTWSRVAVATALALLAATAWRRAAIRLRPPHLLDAATAVILFAYARYATAAPPWELDFIDNWGLKARVFALHGGIDWDFLRNPDYWWSHPDYPPLVPLAFDYLTVMGGGWDDRWLGALNVILAIGALLVVRSIAEQELGSRFAAAVAGLTMVWSFAIPWIGLADGPLVAYMVPALLLIRRGDFTIGAVLLGLAASSKNEGLTFIVAAAFAMATQPELRKNIHKLWPAAAIAAPWLILRAVHGLATDLATGSVLDRIGEHLREPGLYVRLLSENAGGRPMLWAGILIGAFLVFRDWIKTERFLVVTAFLQVLFYIGAYLVTPLGVEFHIRWSWDRLVWHITAILVAATLLPLLRMLTISASSVNPPLVTSDE